MVSVAEATSIILSHPFHPEKEKTSLISSTGRRLAQSIVADRDLPPFNRATMDGIAVRYGDVSSGHYSFKIIGIQAAGKPGLTLANSGDGIEIMTGAVVPEGADTVIRYEDIEIKNEIVTIVQGHIPKKGDHIHFMGMDAKRNDLLLPAGINISPAEVALMASVGSVDVEVFKFPSVAIVSTGDELIPVKEIPKTQQIRLSNAYALASALEEIKCTADLFHIPDQKEILTRQLSAILSSHQVVILSGGVSKGKFDYVPEVLHELGIKKLFHQVAQKPGKPFWFGRNDRHTIFALPGNPVSTYMCFYRFIKPWLFKSMGADHLFPTAILAQDFSFQPALTYFLQVKIQNETGKCMAYPNAGGGSGDFANLKSVDGFLELPAERTTFLAGEVFPYVPFRK